MLGHMAPTKKMGRPPTGAVYKGISIRFQVSPEDENARLEKVARAAGVSKAAFIQRATMEKVDAALKSGRIEVRIPRGR